MTAADAATPTWDSYPRSPTKTPWSRKRLRSRWPH